MTKKFETLFLIISSTISIILLPFAIYKKSFKDWVIVYLVSILGNSLADRYFVKKGFIKYKIRPFQRMFSIHLPFDFFHYPLLLLYYNQWTLNNGPVRIFLKLFPFLIPQVIIETFAEKKTDLITWKKGWSWYHSLISLFVKFLVCRLIIALIRVLNNKKVSSM
ncbi:CBO0543 family protein [Sutcliffiella sp. NC1]|uniref:CBO0543 family protein n=1 Tax=Sutcliffiella sp. NC1 TaxID=3004096 RepID=UPI0022DE2AAD|nr:CBO0543 family protein [Sutcliffiella sp. NC1]WBL13636.1 hypothetical protein O1A01_17160 [Sutcliffiella sp. NC1]